MTDQPASQPRFSPTIYASDLIRAADYRTPLNPLSTDHPAVTVDEAYVVQVGSLAQHIHRNDPMSGAKVTVHQRRPVFGLYPRTAVMGTFEVADLSRLIDPRAQAVMVFRLFKELAGTATTEEDVLDATETVVAGIEVIDYRMAPNDALNHVDVVADNGHIAKILIGEHGADVSHGLEPLKNLSVQLTVNGELAAPPHDAITAPAAAVAALANHLGAQGGKLEDDWFVVVGPLSAPVSLGVGSRIELRINEMAPVILRAR